MATNNQDVMSPSDASTAAPEASAAVRPLRIWPAVVMLTAFWVFIYANYALEMTMFARFMTRFAAFGVLTLAFLVWWLTRRQVPRGERWSAVLILILGLIAVALIADPTLDAFSIFLTASPFVFMAWTAWLWVSREFSATWRRNGLLITIFLALGYFALLRWDGIDGAQRSQFSWRWTPTAEQRFLLAKSESAVALADSEKSTAVGAENWALRPGDWPEFRGPNRDSDVAGVTLSTDWRDGPPVLAWQTGVGPGWSSMIVVDGRLVTQEQRGGDECVACYDATTGNELWVHRDAARFEESLAGAGPRATPTFNEGRIFVFGATGLLNCLDAATGNPIWSRDAATEAEAQLPQWGYSVSPLVVDDLVVVFAGGEGGKSLLAYDAATGEPAWSLAGGTQSYSSPQVVTLAGERQIVMHDNGALRGVRIADGAQLWERSTDNEMAVPMLQPHVVSGSELVLSQEPGLSRIEVSLDGDQWTVSDRWTENSLKPSFNDFVVYEGHIYGLDDGILCCIDLESGQRKWKKGRYGHGQLLLLPDAGQLVVLGESGEVALITANSERLDEVGRFQAIEGKTWNHPVIAEGLLFVRNGEQMAAYRIVPADGTSPGRLAGR